MVESVSQPVGRGFEPQLSHTKDFKSGLIAFLSGTQHMRMELES